MYAENQLTVGVVNGVNGIINARENNALTNSGIILQQDGGGDAKLTFALGSGASFSMGIDNSDSDKFVLSRSPLLGSGNVLSVDSSLNTAFTGNVVVNKNSGYIGVNTTSDPNSYSFKIYSDYGVDQAVRLTVGSSDKVVLQARYDATRMWLGNSPAMKVGIGVTPGVAPTEALDVIGNGKFSGTLTASGIISQISGFAAVEINSDRTSGNLGGFIARRTGDDHSWFQLNPQADKLATYMLFGSGAVSATTKFTFTQDGKLGVGKIGATEALDVVGNGKFSGNVTANAFVKSGGTSSQFLMADGSVSTGADLFQGTSIVFSNKHPSVTVIKYRISRQGNMVTLNLAFTSTGLGIGQSALTIPFDLVADYRPKEPTYFTAITNQTSGESYVTYMAVNTDGTITVLTGSDSTQACYANVTWYLY